MRGYDINEAFCQDCEINIPCMGVYALGVGQIWLYIEKVVLNLRIYSSLYIQQG